MAFRNTLRILAVSALGLTTAVPVSADVDAGSYLAGRQASGAFDFSTATQYFSQALMRDPGNRQLMEFLATSYVGLGDVDRAVTVARQLMQRGADSQIGNMVLLGQAARDGEWDAVLADLDAGQSVGPLFDGLLKGWALVGKGDIAAASAQFDEVSKTKAVQAFGKYHKALALASTGDYAAADDVLSNPADGGLRLTRRGLIAHAEILSQLGRSDEGAALLDDVFGEDVDRALEHLLDELRAGKKVPLDIVTDARDGVAETFFSIANALSNEASPSYTLLYTRMADYLRPDHIEATLLTASALERLGRHELAIKAYGRIPRDNPAWDAAEMGRADALRRSGEPDEAIGVMRQLADARPDLPLIQVALGDALRELERFDEASVAYDKAIDLFETPQESQWIVFFARGIAYERTERWAEAETDFRTALDLKPGQPQVLNYLGYSYVEKHENLDEALDMIERAVAAEPDSGYIADSLGWVFYRLGRYKDAVAPMEKAVELMPVDPVVNDHLGDVYWAVGRTLEARFQWKRALSFVDNAETDGEADPDRMRRKLEVGLDRVLDEEGAPPLTTAKNDG